MNRLSCLQKKQIISLLLGAEPKLLSFLFDSSRPHHLRESAAILIDESWEFPAEERILLRASLDFWDFTGNAFLWEILNLNSRDFARAIFALHEYRKIQSTYERSQSGTSEMESQSPKTSSS